LAKLSSYVQAVPVSTDLIPFTDDPAGTPATKNMLPASLATLLQSLVVADGGLSVDGNAVAQTGISATFQVLTAFDTNAPSVNATSDHTADTVTLTVDGTYDVEFQASFSGTVNKTYEFACFKGGVDTGFKFQRKLGTGGDVGSASFTGRITGCVATDVLDIRVRSTDGGTSATTVHAQFMVSRVRA
jgi:hypothetical protein